MSRFTALPAFVAFAAVLACAGCDASETKKITGGTRLPDSQAPVLPSQNVVQRTTTPDGTTVAELANGMAVILKPVRTAPVVCVQAYVRAGGLYEGRRLGCGLSHLLEHLVAKGAVHEGHAGPPQQTRGRVAEIGGQSNAYTSLAHTCYHINAASSKANDCIDLIADWMVRPQITEEDFRREHGVVQRELEMGKDEPRRQLYYAHMSNAFAGHPAAVPVIGHAEPLARVTREDVLAYHRRMYVPQNMVFCVVGDVDVEASLERICRALAGFDRGRTPQHRLPSVRPAAGTRRVVRTNKALKDVMQRMSFQTVPLVHEDLYALDVLSYVLTRGRAGRLVRKIEREKKLVTSISSSSWTPAWGRGVFSFTFRAEPDKARAAERAVLDELRAVVKKGVTGDELARAKRQKVADFVYARQTAEDIASMLAGDYLSAGDVAFSKNYTDRIQAVTGERVHAMARKYFTFDRMAITRIVPAAEAATRPADAARAAARGEPVVFTLPSGLRVILQPNDAVGLVSMAYVVKGGVLAETPATNGLGALMTALSTRGAGDRSAEQIDAFFANAGGSISGRCGNNSLYWQGTVLDDSFEQALGIFADVIHRPRFENKELEILRPKLLARIKQSEEDWFAQLNKLHRSMFFTNSPYAMLPIGSVKPVKKATVEQIRAYHRKFIQTAAKGTRVLAIFGNFDAAETRRAVEKTSKAVARHDAKAVALPAPAPRRVGPEGKLHPFKTDKKQAGIMVGAPGMKITNLRDRFAITVLDTIISGYHLPAGWLHTELRGKRLVYVVHAYNWAGLAPGAFLTYAACQPDKAPQVVRIIEKNLRRAAAYTPTQREIDLAVNSILTAELLDNQSMSALAMGAALDELYGFGYDFRRKLAGHYGKVTPAEVARVAKKYLSGGYVVTVTTPKPELFEKKRPGSLK